MYRFVIRLDDICPTMDRKKFHRARSHFEAAGIRPLMGVVPNNRDRDLKVDPPDPNFWDMMRDLRAQGWSLSQHGYRHIAHTSDRGLLGVTPRSEFAGRPLSVQLGDLARGREIMAAEGVDTAIFMAPFHSYDSATLRALQSVGFTTLTDGYGLFPWRADEMLFVPQLFQRPAHLGVGIYTMCLHLNKMDYGEIDALGKFVRINVEHIISFDDACSYVLPSLLVRPVGLMLKLALNFKRRRYRQ